MDSTLFKMLKKLRKDIASKEQLPPAIIFQESSLVDMANNYPITFEEMAQMQGVGIGKAKKYGEKFISLINHYVKENNIERPGDILVKTIVKKSSNKVYIIQSLDKKLSISENHNFLNFTKCNILFLQYVSKILVISYLS